jgi:hypothetical protein
MQVPQDVLDDYQKYLNKELRFTSTPKGVYHAHKHRFIKYGLVTPRPRRDAVLKRSLEKPEFQERQRKYLKEWRARHPGYPNRSETEKKEHRARQSAYHKVWRAKQKEIKRQMEEAVKTCVHCQSVLSGTGGTV